MMLLQQQATPWHTLQKRPVEESLVWKLVKQYHIGSSQKKKQHLNSFNEVFD